MRTVHATIPGGARNGLPEPRGYVYRGTGRDELTGDLGDYALEPYRVEYRQWIPDFACGSSSTRPVTQPCGTPAAYRRHIRHGEDPCEACKSAENRAWQDREKAARNNVRRERYRDAIAAGLTAAEAQKMRSRRTA